MGTVRNGNPGCSGPECETYEWITWCQPSEALSTRSSLCWCPLSTGSNLAQFDQETAEGPAMLWAATLLSDSVKHFGLSFPGRLQPLLYYWNSCPWEGYKMEILSSFWSYCKGGEEILLPLSGAAGEWPAGIRIIWSWLGRSSRSGPHRKK